MNKKVEEGNVVCELHDMSYSAADCRIYGYGRFEVIDGSWQKVNMRDSHETVASIIRTNTGVSQYSNKDVVALGAEGTDDCDIQVIYSKDNHEMGLLTLRRC